MNSIARTLIAPSSAAVIATLLFLMPWSSRADTVLETETAELGKKGEWLVSNSIQYEKGPEGKAAFTLFQFEYALTSRSEILIEPFFQEWVWPKGGSKTSGFGDLEITPSYIAVMETDAMPAIATAFKLKVPTASNPSIGTGEYDYYPYLIFGKHFGKDWILNANLGYDFITNIPGENFKNQLIYDLSVERRINDHWSLFGEIFGNSKAAPGEKGTFAGAVAVEYQLSSHFNVFVSTGYDTDKTWNIRPGFNIHF